MSSAFFCHTFMEGIATLKKNKVEICGDLCFDLFFITTIISWFSWELFALHLKVSATHPGGRVNNAHIRQSQFVAWLG